jgi:hypothetical protein
LFNLDRILVSTEEFFALHQGIAEASNDPAFGLKLGTEDRVERYDPVKLAALSARSFRDAVGRLSRYKQLTCPEEICSVERGKECAVQFVWLLAHEQEPPLLVDVCSHGLWPLLSEVLDDRSMRTGSSFNEHPRIERCTRRISTAR